jgi:hypothetical protein
MKKINKMKKLIYIFIALTFLVSCDCVQRVRGTITDSVTKEPIENVDIYKKNQTWNKTETDEKGFFKLSAISGGLTCPPMTIVIEHKDYETLETKIEAGGQKDILLVKKVAQCELSIEAKYKFEDFPVEVYSGKLSAPDFNNNAYASSRGDVKYMTDKCESEGINFGGRFTILQGSCGNMCSFIIMADRETGQFVTIQSPNGYDDENGAYGYEYRKDSRLLIANATLFTDDEFQQSFPDLDLKPKYYVWDNNEFVLLE